MSARRRLRRSIAVRLRRRVRLTGPNIIRSLKGSCVGSVRFVRLVLRRAGFDFSFLEGWEWGFLGEEGVRKHVLRLSLLLSRIGLTCLPTYDAKYSVSLMFFSVGM